MTNGYAKGTRVSTVRSQEEIERILRRFRCDKTIWMRDDAGGMAILAFQRGAVTYKFVLPFPTLNDPDIARTPSRGIYRSAEQRRAVREEEIQRRFRSLSNYVKAILDAVDSGIITAEEALLPYAVLPGGSTVAQHLGPRMTMLAEGGEMPDIFLALPSGRP